MSLPFMEALRQKYPQAEITSLARPSVAAILRHHPAVDKIILCDDQGMHRGLGLFSMAQNLRGQKYDVAYILPNSFSSALMMKSARIPKRIGFSTDGRRWLLTHPVKKTPAIRSIHETCAYLSLLDGLPPSGAPVQPKLYLTDEEVKTAADRLEALGVNRNQLLIGLVPGAAYGTAKRWLPERYALLTQRLVQTSRAQVILFGSASEAEVAKTVEEKANCAIFNMAAKTGLREFAALLGQCSLVVCNDSGAMHLAAAVGRPLVAIFGPTNPVTTSPVSADSHLVRHPVECSPCLLRHCPIDHRCMRSISVDEVYMTVLGVIERLPESISS